MGSREGGSAKAVNHARNKYLFFYFECGSKPVWGVDTNVLHQCMTLSCFADVEQALRIKTFTSLLMLKRLDCMII